MNEDVLSFPAGEVAPSRAAVFEHQGIATGRAVPPEIEALCDSAFALCAELSDPVGVCRELSQDEFAAVFHGEGKNEPSTPVGDILRRADRLSLFAVTLGPRVCQEIADRFASNDLALGCMLDSVASAAADQLAERIERHYFESLVAAGTVGPEARALRYSPGYCGWDISGQGTLFEQLQPERIGISLRESFLMDPLKSVSGVVLVGPARIHEFDMTHSFCTQCETQGCRERISALYAD